MPRGRKPTPGAINAVKGNPGKRKKPEQPPELAEGDDEAPACPDHLNEEAQEEWARVVPLLQAMNVLKKVDGAALAAYCVAWARWREAERHLAVHGLVVRAPKSGHPMQNPFLSVANKAVEQIHRFCAEFGMTPSARMRVKSEGAAAARPEDKFFDGPRLVA